MKIKGQSVLTIFFILVSSIAIGMALNWDWKTSVVPLSCGVVMLVLSSIQFVKELKATESEKNQILDVGFKQETMDQKIILGGMKYFGCLIGLYLGMLLIGLYLSVLLFVFLYLQASHKVRVGMSIVMAVVTVAVIYIVIEYIIQESLPESLLVQGIQKVF